MRCMRVSVRSACWTSSSVSRRCVEPGGSLFHKSGRGYHASVYTERPYRFQSLRVNQLFQYYKVKDMGHSTGLVRFPPASPCSQREESRTAHRQCGNEATSAVSCKRGISRSSLQRPVYEVKNKRRCRVNLLLRNPLSTT